MVHIDIFPSIDNFLFVIIYYLNLKNKRAFVIIFPVISVFPSKVINHIVGMHDIKCE